MSSEKTRREFLITASTGIVVGLASVRAGRADSKYQRDGSTALRTRRNVVSSEAQSDLNSLRDGVGVMKEMINSAPDDPRGWILQAFIHGDCQNFNDCQHGNWFFAPWHRSYLFYFEQLIQHFSGNSGFALPYWDWSRTHSVPASFYGDNNPLNDTVSLQDRCGPGAPTAGRGRTVNESFSQNDLDTYVGPAVVNRIQSNPDFATYGGSDFGGGELEGTPHNFVHRWVGGSKFSNMVQTFSPADPIFWMHHCNVDRLYSNWLQRPGHNAPSVDEWTQRSFNDFYDPDGNQAGGSLTCEFTKDTANLGYQYDRTLLLPETLAVASAGGKARVISSMSASAANAKTDGGVLSFAATPPSTEALQIMNATAVGSRDYSVRLRLENVKTPENQNTGVHVFIGDGITENTPVTAPGYVGSFTFFSGHSPGGEGGHSHYKSTISLNAAEALRNLHGDTSLPQGETLKVSLVTQPLYEGSDSRATVSDVSPDKIHLDVVDLGS